MVTKDTNTREDGMERVTKSIKIDPKLWRRARVQALSEGKAIQDLVAELLAEYLKKAERKGGDR
jgi:predicted HicB family RNase H-like nuclease